MNGQSHKSQELSADRKGALEASDRLRKQLRQRRLIGESTVSSVAWPKGVSCPGTPCRTTGKDARTLSAVTVLGNRTANKQCNSFSIKYLRPQPLLLLSGLYLEPPCRQNTAAFPLGDWTPGTVEPSSATWQWGNQRSHDLLKQQGALNVRRPNWYLLILAGTLVCSLVASHAAAQAPQSPAGPAGGAIGLLDVNYIFKNHHRFKQQMEEMRGDVERAEATVQKEREAIQRLAEQLEQYKGTRDYRAMEQDIADRQAKLAVQVRMQQREFLEREARIYHNTYKEIWQAVDYYCRSNNLAMVLRFNGDPADTTKPEEVLRDINKPVVWYRENMDITGHILSDINRDQQRVGQPATPGSARGPFQR